LSALAAEGLICAGLAAKSVVKTTKIVVPEKEKVENYNNIDTAT
jgi:hypothetical protein